MGQTIMLSEMTLGNQMWVALTAYCYFACGSGCEVWYADEYICVSVCEDISGTTRAIVHIFCACCLWMWLGPSPTPLRYVMYFRFCG